MQNDKTFEDILMMIKKACAKAFYDGARGEAAVIIKCATQIYIEQMKDIEVSSNE